jgi:hypothetical protein
VIGRGPHGIDGLLLGAGATDGRGLPTWASCELFLKVLDRDTRQLGQLTKIRSGDIGEPGRDITGRRATFKEIAHLGPETLCVAIGVKGANTRISALERVSWELVRMR